MDYDGGLNADILQVLKENAGTDHVKLIKDKARKLGVSPLEMVKISLHQLDEYEKRLN